MPAVQALTRSVSPVSRYLFSLLTGCTVLLRRRRQNRSPQVSVQKVLPECPSKSAPFSCVCGGAPESGVSDASCGDALQAFPFHSVALYRSCFSLIVTVVSATVSLILTYLYNDGISVRAGSRICVASNRSLVLFFSPCTSFHRR